MSSFEPIGPASEAIKGPAKSGWEPVNVREYEAHAAEYMPKNAFDYYASGANDMITLRENRWDLLKTTKTLRCLFSAHQNQANQ